MQGGAEVGRTCDAVPSSSTAYYRGLSDGKDGKARFAMVRAHLSRPLGAGPDWVRSLIFYAVASAGCGGEARLRRSAVWQLADEGVAKSGVGDEAVALPGICGWLYRIGYRWDRGRGQASPGKPSHR